MDDGVEVCFLLRVLQQSRNRDVGNVVAVELQETQFVDERGQVVEVVLIFHLLRLQTLLVAAFGQPVVARVQLKRRESPFHQLAGNLDACFQMVQACVACVPLEDLGGHSFVGSEEVELHGFASKF